MTSRLWHLGRHFRKDPSRRILLANTPAHILGVRYEDLSVPNVYGAFEHHFESILWCTYRKDFSPIKKSILLSFSYGITSDTGWGCMMRSGQMMLANGLLYHYLGRAFRKPRLRLYETTDSSVALVQEGCLPRQYHVVLDWFFDDPSRRFSIHRIVETGVAFGKQPAQWHGPSTICNVLSRLVNFRGDPHGGESDDLRNQARKKRRRGHENGSLHPAPPFDPIEKDIRLYCGRDATLFVDELLSLAHGPPRAPKRRMTAATATATTTAPNVEHRDMSRHARPGFSSISTPVDEGDGDEEEFGEIDRSSPAASGAAAAGGLPPPPVGDADDEAEVFTPLLIFISIRLGVEQINPCYLAPLQRLLRFPYTLGIAGGRPRHSLYFVGFQEDDFFFLDPHTEQKTSTNPNTYHTNEIRSVKFQLIDPSMAIGFYIPTQEDLFEFLRKARQEFTECPYPIFGIQDTRPKYMIDAVRVLDD